MPIHKKEQLKQLIIDCTSSTMTPEEVDAAAEVIKHDFHPLLHTVELSAMLREKGLRYKAKDLVLTMLFRVADRTAIAALKAFAADESQPRRLREDAQRYLLVLRVWRSPHHA